MTQTRKSKPENPGAETHAFQAEVQQLLHLMIHSLYSNKEIFLRELVSNASDACDKLRFEALTDNSLLEDGEDPGIWIEVDEKKKIIRVRDNGIGMTHDEVIRDIGTIARSGTRAFLEKMKQEDAAAGAFIGQFGVGFYSCFLVAREVTLLTRKAGAKPAEGVKWVSDGSGEYTLESVERPQRGTEIIIALNKDDKEYADQLRIRNIVSRYSDHVSLPIWMRKEPGEAPGGDAEQDKDKKKPRPEWETVNKGSALWSRPRNEISEQEYNGFYTSLTYDPEPPAMTVHNRVEGKLEYISLFYVPARAPFDLWDREQRHGVKLYVRRIFIADDARQLMPNYLRFVRGLVDSADLPLNVSREFLQQNREIDRIRAASVKKILGEFKKLASRDEGQYHALWQEYGKVLKEGLVEDVENQDTLSKLARFASTHDDEQEQKVSLDDYVKRMPMKQKAIYYVTAENHDAARSSPHLEVFRKNHVEVLLLSDPVDEWVVGRLNEYDGKPLKSIARGALDLDELSGEDGAKQDDKVDESMQPLVEKFKAALKDQVKDVRVSTRLVDSPSCLVADEFDMGANMERILQAIGQDTPGARPILEINPGHEIVRRIDPQSESAGEWAWLLFDQAALAEGATLKNPGDFVKRMNRLLVEQAG